MKRSTFFSLVVFCAVTFSKKIPSYVTPCKRDSDELNLCIANAWEALRPNVGKGIPKLKIPPLDPFLLPQMSMNSTSRSLDLEMSLTQLIVTGMTKVTVSKLNVDLADLTGSVSLAFTDLNVTTLYAMDALLMQIIPMKGKGQYNGTINNAKVNLKGKAKLGEKNKRGHSFLKLTELKLKLFIADARGLLMDTSKNSQYEMLTKAANIFYEENKRDVLNIITPVVAEFCESLVLEVANRILSSVPFEEMFPTTASK